MLTIYKTNGQVQAEIEAPVSGCWINVIDPTPEEKARLEEMGIAPELITYSLDLDEMPRVERDEEYTFILLRIPYFQKGSDVPYTTIPLGFILKDNYVVTVCRHENEIVKALTGGKFRGLKTAKRYRFILYALLETANRYLGYLREIDHAVEALEVQLQKSTRNSEVLELLKYQKSLVYFTTALRSNEVMMERLSRMQMFTQYEEDQDLLEDVLTENQQAIQMVNITTDILSSMVDAFASIISNNLNAVMKLLAAMTIILNLPTIVFSYYGMNVNLPAAERPMAFLIVFVLALILTGIAGYIFYKRDWF